MTEVPVARQTSNVSVPVWYPLLTPLPHPPHRIAVFRALYLGDLLLAVPALRALRLRFPDAEITLIGLAWAEGFARRFHHYIDRFVEFAGYPGIAEVAVDEERTWAFVSEQQHYGYDLVLQMHGSGRTSNPCVLAFGGQATVGYYEQRKPRDLLLALPYPHTQHEIERNLALAMLVGCTELDRKYDLFLLAREQLPLESVGMQTEELGDLGDREYRHLHRRMAQYRFLFSPMRYTSLPLAVIEGMTIGMPIVALATTELPTVIEHGKSGFASCNMEELMQGMRYLLTHLEEAQRMGDYARKVALERFGLERFKSDWNAAFTDCMTLPMFRM